MEIEKREAETLYDKWLVNNNLKKNARNVLFIVIKSVDLNYNRKYANLYRSRNLLQSEQTQ